jgi:hypothetical protein
MRRLGGDRFNLPCHVLAGNLMFILVFHSLMVPFSNELK